MPFILLRQTTCFNLILICNLGILDLKDQTIRFALSRYENQRLYEKKVIIMWKYGV